MPSADRLASRRRLTVAAVLAVAAVAAVMAYVSAPKFLEPSLDARPPAQLVEGAGPGSPDALRFSFYDQPRQLPEIRFTDAEGRERTLADFRGRPILLNIWATWCVPCRKEMPALDRLQAAVGDSELLVLPLSIDRQGVPVVKKFYDDLHLKTLGIYVDASGAASHALKVVGVPTTLLIDRDGREVGRKIGEAEWDSPDMVALLHQHLGAKASMQGQR